VSALATVDATAVTTLVAALATVATAFFTLAGRTKHQDLESVLVLIREREEETVSCVNHL
jgi:hypothetical protein